MGLVTWTKLSDDFSDDCWTLSDAAFRLHVEGLVWNNRKLVDLHLNREDVRRFAKHPEAVAELVAGGWWRETDDGYVIQHHAMYQRNRADVVRQQAANQENGRKGGRPRKPGRERPAGASGAGTEPISGSVSEPVRNQGAEESQAVVADPPATLTETESVSGSPTERDRTGQDRALENGTTELRVATLTERKCGYCHELFVPDRDTQIVHPDVCPSTAVGAA